MCEIFATVNDYYDFAINTCSKCNKLNGECETEKRLDESYWENGFDFPIDKIHRKGDKWICDDYKPVIKESFIINEDMMKQPTKGSWVKNMFKHK